MYFWDINGLKEEIINYKISEQSVFLYIFIYLIYPQATFIFRYFRNYGKEVGLGFYGDLFFYSINAIILAIGIYYAYHCNGKNKGERFAVKLISLSWVVSIRFFVFIFSFYFILFILLSILKQTNLLDTTISRSITNSTSLGVVLLTPIWIYYRIGHHIKDINRRIKEKSIT